MKRHIHTLLITLVILLTLFFILGETSWRTTLTETISSIPVVTQRAAVSDFNSSLVAYYTFDDTTNDSAGSNNGTVSGGPTYTTGKVNRALVLDGVDDVVSTPAGISGSDFSYSFWMKNTGLTSGTPIAFGSYKFCDRDATDLHCTVDGNSSGSASISNAYDGSWHHIVFVNSGNTQKIYKDGVLAGSATETVNTSGAQVRIGNRVSSSSFFAGSVDDVRVYSKALSSNEVSELYALGSSSSVSTNYVETTPSNTVVTPTVTDTVTVVQPGPSVGDGINWYIDGSVSSSGDGKGWASAWKTFSNIDWTKIVPGATIWISGGVYDEGLTITKGGTQSAPVRIKASQESGHNGLITMRGLAIGANWVTIDGAKDDRYTSVIGQNTLNVPLIKNNQNIKLLSGVYFWSDYSQGQKIYWLDITDKDLDDRYGVRINSDVLVRDIEIAYCWIHGVGQDAVYLTTNKSPTWNNLVVHHSLMESMGDDGLEIAGGSTVYNNIIRNSRFARGHPDGIQSSNNYNRFYNNIIGDFGSSLLITQGQAPEGGDYGHIQIYGNVFYKKDVLTSTTELELKWYPPDHSWDRTNIYYRDWVIANNTFAYLNAGGVSFQARPDFVKNVFPREIVIKNNIFYEFTNSVFGISYPTYTNQDGKNNWSWSQSDVVFDYNNIASSKDSGTSVAYFGVKYRTADELNTGTIHTHNTGTVPAFINPSGLDFHLAVTDTAARNRGDDLSYLNLPGLNIDIEGKPRGQNGAWDMGAFEVSGGGTSIPTVPALGSEVNTPSNGGLVARLSFDSDNPAQAVFADASGQNNSGNCQSAFALNGTIYNQCPTVATGPTGNPAMKFSGSTCKLESDYIAIPRSSSISRLNQGTVSLWVASDDAVYFNQKILDTFTAGTPNTWMIGKDGDPYYTLTINSDTGVESDLFTFPGGKAPLGSWNHYAFTWDGYVVKGYYNGIYFGQSSMVGFSAFALSDYLAIGALKHNYPRNTNDTNCWNQYGFPSNQKYVYPNAGFLNGRLDDVRIYNRPLDATEIASLASGATTPSNQYILSISKSGTGSGAVSGSGISCGKHCAEAYTIGTTVTLTASPSANSTFVGWAGACSGTGVCTLTMDQVRYVSAVFGKTTETIAAFNAPTATITSPFVINGNAVVQKIATDDPSKGGKLVYPFTVTTEGDYLVFAIVNAPSQSDNSLFINIDTEPTSPTPPTAQGTMIWDIYTTAGFESRVATWRGTGSDSPPSNVPHVFHLAAGAHSLIIRGRETNVSIQSVTIERQGGLNVAVDTLSTTPIIGDFNRDGLINSVDFSLLVSSWNKSSTTYDLNGDGLVNTLDYAIMAQHWSR